MARNRGGVLGEERREQRSWAGPQRARKPRVSPAATDQQGSSEEQSLLVQVVWLRYKV